MFFASESYLILVAMKNINNTKENIKKASDFSKAFISFDWLRFEFERGFTNHYKAKIKNSNKIIKKIDS